MNAVKKSPLFPLWFAVGDVIVLVAIAIEFAGNVWFWAGLAGLAAVVFALALGTRPISGDTRDD